MYAQKRELKEPIQLSAERQKGEVKKGRPPDISPQKKRPTVDGEEVAASRGERKVSRKKKCGLQNFKKKERYPLYEEQR